MKLILCLLLLLFPNKIYASNIELNVIQDEYNNIVISSNDLDYINKIESIEFYDGESSIIVEVIKTGDINAIVHKESKTLTLYMSKLAHISSGSYKIYVNANGYEKLRADEMGIVIDRQIIDAPDDVLLIKNENGLEIKSKIYNYIDGFTLDYMSENSIATYSFIQFSKSINFTDSIIYENAYSKLPFSDIYMSDDYYCILVSNDALKSMGFEEDIYYYVQIQSASFKPKSFDSFILVEKSEEKEDEKLDEDLIDRPNFEDDEIEVEEELKDEDNSDLIIALLGFFGVLITSAIAYILYMKNDSKK